PCVGPNRASIPPAASAQESDSRSNVILATQFFQRPARAGVTRQDSKNDRAGSRNGQCRPTGSFAARGRGCGSIGRAEASRSARPSIAREEGNRRNKNSRNRGLQA